MDLNPSRSHVRIAAPSSPTGSNIRSHCPPVGRIGSIGALAVPPPCVRELMAKMLKTEKTETRKRGGSAMRTAAASQHQWHIRFDRVVCRNCDAVRGKDDRKRCTGVIKIRPMAAMRQQQSNAKGERDGTRK